MNTRRARRRRFFILSDKRKRMQTNDNGHGCSLRNGGGLFLHPGHTIRRGQTISGGRSQFATAGALPQDQRKRMQTPSNYQPRQRRARRRRSRLGLGLFADRRRRRCIIRHSRPGPHTQGNSSVAAEARLFQQWSVLIQKWGKVIISKLAVSVGATKSANLPTIVKNKQLFFGFYGVRSSVLTFQSFVFNTKTTIKTAKFKQKSLKIKLFSAK